MNTEHDFEQCRAYGKGIAANTHPDTIRSLIPGCIRVEPAPLADDLRGIDFVAHLRRGATINIDIKSRTPGCSEFWRPALPMFGVANEPELALEKWSKVPKNGHPGSVGWTLDEAKLTDYTLHVFDPQDSTEVFLLPFQLLRAAFVRRIDGWYPRFKVAQQHNKHGASGDTWTSEAVFVPAWCILEAISEEMRRSLYRLHLEEQR